MANNNGNLLNTDVVKPTTGTATDYYPQDQPEGVATFALNTINQTSQGNKSKRNTEQGNSISGSLTTGYIPMGRCYINNGRTVIFSVSIDETTSEIGIVDKNSVYTPSVNSRDLGFKLNKQIQCIYRLRRGCEDTIYFTDGNQEMRNYNFQRPQDYYTSEYLAFLSLGFGVFTGSIWDSSKFSLFPPYSVPSFLDLQVLTGGTIIPGTYNFAIRYLDADLNPTNWIYNSQLVSIYQSDTGNSYYNIFGSSNVLNDSISGIINTNKSVELTLGSLDNNYLYYQIAVIGATSGTGQITTVFISPSYPITQTNYIFDGNTDGYTVGTTAELAIGRVDIETVQHIEQIENRLILDNIAGKQAPYCSYQQAASQIVSNYVIRESLDVDPTQDGNAKDPNTYWDQEGYMGDEVYAMAIIYIFTNGLETPAYHIPGRSPGEYKDLSGDIHSTGDQSIITTWNPDLTPWFTDADSYNALPPSLKMKQWQVYDTSIQYSPSGITESYGAMSYWENKDSDYTSFSDCLNQDYWGTDACGVTLLNTPIRHHKFPSRTKEPHIRGGNVFTGSTGLYYSVSLNSGQTFPVDGLTLSITYQLNGGADQYYNVTILPSDLPIENFLIDQFAGDYSTINIVSISGTLTDPDNSAITTYDVFKNILSNSVVNGTIVRALGIQFSNITYPDPDIVGHYFVRGARDVQNRTVLDKGFANTLRKQTVNSLGYTTFSYFTGDINENTNDSYLFTPRFLFNKETLVGDYIRFENEFIYQQGFVSSNTYNGAGSIFKETDVKLEVRSQNYNGVLTHNGGHLYSVNKSIIMNGLGENTIFEGPSTPLYNLSWSNKIQVINTTPAIPRVGLSTDGGNNGLRNMPYVSYKIDQNVHPVLSNIVYQRTHNSSFTPSDSNIVFGGDTFITYLNLCNSLYRKQAKGLLSTILNIVLIVAAVVVTFATVGVTAPIIAAAISASAFLTEVSAAIVVTALLSGIIGITGDVIGAITSLIGSDLSGLVDDSEFEAVTGSGGTLSPYVIYSNEFLQSIYVESEVNVGLRQMENHVCGDFFNYSASIQQYFLNRWMYFDQSSNAWLPKGYCCPEVYHYNLDYSRQNLQNQYFPLPETYDCCSNCQEEHPNRTQWSEQSFQEELTDNYKIFLANNYVDSESEHGPHTNIFKKNNNLFLQASECIWVLPQSQQEKVNDELITYIGTGDFFSIPVKKIIDSELGSGGSQHKWATLSVPQGVLLVNELEGKISIFNQSLQEISKIGHERYFKNNLQDFFARQFQFLTGTQFPNTNNPANPYGVGIHSTYDKGYERIIITKRDYLLLPAFTSTFQAIYTILGVLPVGLSAGQLVFDLTTNKFIVVGSSRSNYTNTNFSNPAFFQNKSWTMSYSLDDNTWTGWHSYIPNFYFYNQTNFYSMLYTASSIWQHNIPGLYLSFYGIQVPHILEFILRNSFTMSERYSQNTVNPIDTRTLEDVSLQTVAEQYDSVNDDFFEQRYITFNKMIAYNSRQTTGLQTLIPKDLTSDLDYLPTMISQNPGQMLITRKEQNWNINDFRDYRTDITSPIFTKAWSMIYTDFFIDKVLDPTLIDFNKDWTQLEVLRDKYVILRLIFDNFTNIQLSTNYILDTSGESAR